MTWSYLSSDPGSSDRSWVRLRIGDHSSGEQLLQDEEIEVFLSDAGSKYSAAAAAARAIGAHFARKVDKAVGKLRISMQQASEGYFDLADRLEREASIGDGATGSLQLPYAGGISLADKAVDESDTDAPDYAFTRGQFDHP